MAFDYINCLSSIYFGKERQRKKPRITRAVVDLCDERGGGGGVWGLKIRQLIDEGAKEYR